MQYLSKSKPLLTILFALIANFVLAQQPNPFSSIGKKADIIDVSKGKYVEIIEKDSLERIGSVIVNRHTRKIERLIDEHSLLVNASDNSQQSRFFSVDPIAAKFPYYSPYQFAGNMPIWASDLDGLEPNFRHKGNGVNGVGLFDPGQLSNIQRHSTALTVGKEGKQFQIQWLLNNNGEAIGYLASRVIPEEEYKQLYGGSGRGLQESYVIEMDKFFEFARNTDQYYNYSRNAELNDLMYGEIERDPIKRLFDPRAWLMGRVIGVTGGLANQLLLRTNYAQRLIAKASEFTRLETLSGNQSSRAVGDIMSKMKAGVKMEPIEVFEHNGKRYVLDGHHRLEAATRLGIDIEYKTVTLDDVIKSGRYKSADEIFNAAAEASSQRVRLNNKLVNSEANK